MTIDTQLPPDILDRNPQFAAAFEIEAAKVGGGALTPTGEWHRIRELGLNINEARRIFSAHRRAERDVGGLPDPTREARLRAKMLSDEACDAVIAAEREYRAACDAYFLGDAK